MKKVVKKRDKVAGIYHVPNHTGGGTSMNLPDDDAVLTKYRSTYSPIVPTHKKLSDDGTDMIMEYTWDYQGRCPDPGSSGSASLGSTKKKVKVNKKTLQSDWTFAPFTYHDKSGNLTTPINLYNSFSCTPKGIKLK